MSDDYKGKVSWLEEFGPSEDLFFPYLRTRFLCAEEVVPACTVLKLQLGNATNVGLEVGEQYLGHCVCVLLANLFGNLHNKTKTFFTVQHPRHA